MHLWLPETGRLSAKRTDTTIVFLQLSCGLPQKRQFCSSLIRSARSVTDNKFDSRVLLNCRSSSVLPFIMSHSFFAEIFCTPFEDVPPNLQHNASGPVGCGESVRFWCERGHLEGSPVLKCNKLGDFDYPIPECIGKSIFSLPTCNHCLQISNKNHQ